MAPTSTFLLPRWASANQFFHLSFADFATSVLMSNTDMKTPDIRPIYNLNRDKTTASELSLQGPERRLSASGGITSSVSRSVNWVTAGRTTSVKSQASARVFSAPRKANPFEMDVYLNEHGKVYNALFSALHQQGVCGSCWAFTAVALIESA